MEARGHEEKWVHLRQVLEAYWSFQVGLDRGWSKQGEKYHGTCNYNGRMLQKNSGKPCSCNDQHYYFIQMDMGFMK